MILRSERWLPRGFLILLLAVLAVAGWQWRQGAPLSANLMALVPGDAFGASGEGYCRVSYAYSVEHLTEAMKRIRAFLWDNGIRANG